MAAKLKKKAKAIKKPVLKVKKKPGRKPKTEKLAEFVSELDQATAPLVPGPVEWYIVHTFADNMQVFGLANDQRIYRWNTRAALWVLHKEGL